MPACQRMETASASEMNFSAQTRHWRPRSLVWGLARPLDEEVCGAPRGSAEGPAVACQNRGFRSPSVTYSVNLNCLGPHERYRPALGATPDGLCGRSRIPALLA